MLSNTKRVTILLSLLIGFSLCQALPEIESNQKYENFLASYEAKFKNLKINPSDSELFMKGYFSGLELFNNLLTNSTCLQNGEILLKDALKLYDIIQDFDLDISKITEIIIIAKSIIANFNSEVEACKEAEQIAVEDIHRIVDRIKKANYLEQLGTHLIFNMVEVKRLISVGFIQFHEKQMQEAGLNFGKVTKLVAFWDL